MAVRYPDIGNHLGFATLLRPIQSVSFDKAFASSQHLPVKWIEYGMMTLIAMTIVATLKWWVSYWLLVY